MTPEEKAITLGGQNYTDYGKCLGYYFPQRENAKLFYDWLEENGIFATLFGYVGWVLYDLPEQSS